MPPHPITGIRTLRAHSHAQRSAIGLIAVPEYPPCTVWSPGLRVRQSICIPRTVFTAVIPSAPAASTAQAISPMRDTFGDSLAKIGFRVSRRTRSITRAAMSGSVANGSFPCWTFGQERFTSSASTAG
jgi:hypothetical protein